MLNAASFVEENLKTIFAYSLSRVSNKEDAEDLTNDIVLAILQSADKIRNPEAFYGYVWSIAANTYKKFLRKKRDHRSIEENDAISDDADMIERILEQEEIKNLRREIALLSKECRECTVAYYYEELSCMEVSQKLNISLEMVKYYLFKTRKILKEGLPMEREFGEKSFRPTPFQFRTFFSGNSNQEYYNLFTRKLPGQILVSAYYTPMTIRELAIELGVASVYLEDEIALLERYELITKLPGGKYQSNLIIFTEDFAKEFQRNAEKFVGDMLVEIVESMKQKLDRVRRLNPICEKLSEQRLLWGMFWMILYWGHDKFLEKHPEYQENNVIYEGTVGINYGELKWDIPEEYELYGIAGYAGIDLNYYASAVDFGIFSEKNNFFRESAREKIKEKIYRTVTGEMSPEFMVLSKADEEKFAQIISSELALVEVLFERLFVCACQIMHVHAPKSVEKQIELVAFHTLYFNVMGMIGVNVVKSGAMKQPDFDGPAGICVRENSESDMENIMTRVLV